MLAFTTILNLEEVTTSGEVNSGNGYTGGSVGEREGFKVEGVFER